jgi:hypothetical protein
MDTYSVWIQMVEEYISGVWRMFLRSVVHTMIFIPTCSKVH